MTEFERVIITLFCAGLDYEQIKWIHKVYTKEELPREMFDRILRKELKEGKQ